MRKYVSLEDRIRLAYVEHGDPGGEVVVLLHGITDSSFSFSRLMPLLDPGRYHAYALDLRGHGESERPLEGYAMDDFADDVVAFLDFAGVARAILVGHSMGSVIARRVAARRPERVEGLVLIGSSVRFELAADFVAAVAALRDPVPADFAREFQVSTVVDGLPQEFVDAVVAESLKVPARVWQAAFEGLLEADDRRDLGSIAVPTRLLWGELDPLFGREQQERLLDAIPGARLVAYPDTGHNPHWQRPDDVAREITTVVTAAV